MTPFVEIQQAGSGGSFSDLYLYRTQFSSVPPGKCQHSTIKQTMTASFYVLSNSLFINQPTSQCYIVWSTDSIIK
jgi:hypothetical protein